MVAEVDLESRFLYVEHERVLATVMLTSSQARLPTYITQMQNNLQVHLQISF